MRLTSLIFELRLWGGESYRWSEEAGRGRQEKTDVGHRMLGLQLRSLSMLRWCQSVMGEVGDRRLTSLIFKLHL
jgi:hypothetical protein